MFFGAYSPVLLDERVDENFKLHHQSPVDYQDAVLERLVREIVESTLEKRALYEANSAIPRLPGFDFERDRLPDRATTKLSIRSRDEPFHCSPRFLLISQQGDTTPF